MSNQSTYIPAPTTRTKPTHHFFGYDPRRWRHATQMNNWRDLDRDWQRSKVYTTELDFQWSPDACKQLSYEETVTLVKKVLRSSVVTTRWGHRDMRVEFSNRRKGAIAWKRRIAFGGDMMQPFVILHEIAHTLCPEWEQHGRLFARTYLELVGWFLGADEKKRFRAALRANKVKLSPRRGVSHRRNVRHPGSTSSQ